MQISHERTVASTARWRVWIVSFVDRSPDGGYEIVARALAVSDQAVGVGVRVPINEIRTLMLRNHSLSFSLFANVTENSPIACLAYAHTRAVQILSESLVQL
jgi:hypothetical protein